MKIEGEMEFDVPTGATHYKGVFPDYKFYKQRPATNECGKSWHFLQEDGVWYFSRYGEDPPEGVKEIPKVVKLDLEEFLKEYRLLEELANGESY